MDLRVFLVEDLQGMRELIRDLCAAIGGLRIVATASTEAEAMLWLQDNPGAWDLAIIDLVLDQGSGMGVVRHCKQGPQSGKVVVFSSYATPGIAAHCIALGADAVFDKSDTTGFIGWLHDQMRGQQPSP
jgi:DNA-binding NarL/FixJ family response regulator